jgi:hypothetical protein
MPHSHKWNPTLGSDCSGLYYGWWVCIGIQPQTVTARFEYTITAAPVVVPAFTGQYTPTIFPQVNSSFTATPTQSGLAQDCRAFHQAVAVSLPPALHPSAPPLPLLDWHTNALTKSRGAFRAIPAGRYCCNTTSSRSSSSSRGIPLYKGTATAFGRATGIA